MTPVNTLARPPSYQYSTAIERITKHMNDHPGSCVLLLARTKQKCLEAAQEAFWSNTSNLLWSAPPLSIPPWEASQVLRFPYGGMMHLGWTTEADGPPLWQSTDVWCHDVVCTGFDPDDLPPAERHWFDLYALNRVVDNGTVFLCETSTWVPPRETKTFCPKSPIVDLDPPTRANKGTSEDSYRHFAPFVDNKAGFWIPANARDRAECEQHLRMICEEVPVDMNPAAWRAAVLAHFELAPPTPKMFWILLRTPSSARRVAGNIAECIRMDYSDAGHWSATVAAYKRACAPRAQVRPERPTWKARLHF